MLLWPEGCFGGGSMEIVDVSVEEFLLMVDGHAGTAQTQKCC